MRPPDAQSFLLAILTYLASHAVEFSLLVTFRLSQHHSACQRHRQKYWAYTRVVCADSAELLHLTRFALASASSLTCV